MSRQSEGDPQDRVRELEAEPASIRRRLLSVPDMDRHYAYRMRVNVNKVVDSIAERLHQWAPYTFYGRKIPHAPSALAVWYWEFRLA